MVFIDAVVMNSTHLDGLNSMPQHNDTIYFEAVYPFEGRQNDELSFKAGDIIIVSLFPFYSYNVLIGSMDYFAKNLSEKIISYKYLDTIYKI